MSQRIRARSKASVMTWWDANAELVDPQGQSPYVKTLVEGHATFVDRRTGAVAWRDPHPEVHRAPDAPA